MPELIHNHESDEYDVKVYNMRVDVPIEVPYANSKKGNTLVRAEYLCVRIMSMRRDGVPFAEDTIVVAADGPDYSFGDDAEVVYRSQRALTIDELLFTLNRSEFGDSK